MLERYSDDLRTTFELASLEAQRFCQEYIGTEHLLLAFLRRIESLSSVRGSIAGIFLEGMLVDVTSWRKSIERRLPTGPEMVTMGRLPFTSGAERALEYARQESHDSGSVAVGEEHFLLGLLRLEDGIAAESFREVGLTYSLVRTAIPQIIKYPAAPATVPVLAPESLSTLPIAVAGDPTLITREEYAELVTLLGDIVRENGGKGVERVLEQDCDVTDDAVVRK